MPRKAVIRVVIWGGCVTGVVLLLTAAALRPGRTAGPCSVIRGPAMLPDVPETSGLAVSRRTPGVLWSHNDSGHDSVLFALDVSGSVRGRARAPIRTRDWEDVSAARCPFGACLYIADIGDNERSRRRITIYRVSEPAPTDAVTTPPDVFTASYADGPHNAEAMFVLGEDLFIVTRDRVGAVYRSSAAGSKEIVFRRVGELGLGAVTDAEASPDEKAVVVRTSDEAVLYRTADVVAGRYEPYANISLDALKEPQGEAVALGANGFLYLSSEGRGWNRSGRLLTLRCGTTLLPGA